MRNFSDVQFHINDKSSIEVVDRVNTELRYQNAMLLHDATQ